MEIILGISVFITIALVILGIFFFVKSRWNPEAERVQKELWTLSMRGKYDQIIDITRKRRKFSNIPWLDTLLSKIPFMRKIDLLMQQSDAKHTLGIFLLTTGCLACISFLLITHFSKSLFISIPAGGFMGAIPFVYLSRKRTNRTKKFEELLPQALDTIARSLRAGHAFASGLQTVAQEFTDPIRTEFAKVVEELNFGIGIKESMLSLAERVDSQDLRFFTVAVIIQRETGGDLAEILENIARLMRERFKLYGRVRILSAEGKLSAMILIAIPILLVFYISLFNPTHLQTFLTDPLGRIFSGLSVFMMLLGAAIMRRMILAIKI